MAQDTLQRSKEAYQDALDEMRETHARIVEDLRFSNPAQPEQWPAEMLKLRTGRPSYTFDRTNQFIQQVVNDARQNKPSIDVIPADSVADPDVAEQLGGVIRHVEYVSRAGIAYDTAIELSARAGLGWLRVVPEVLRPDTNEQEVRILRVHDPLSCLLEAGWTQPDGSDARRGWATTLMTRTAFRRAYPKAKDSAAWIDERGTWTLQRGDMIRIAEEFEITETQRNRLLIELPDGRQQTLGEAEYWQLARELGFQPQVLSQFEAVERAQKWRKMTGAEVLEETDFPSQFLPVIPVLGFELWIEGERFLCGLTRRLMDGQRLHNYEMSAWAETMAVQPKAPFLVPEEAVTKQWERLNAGNPAYLTYNHVDADGNPLPPPQRLNPPPMPAAFAQGAVMASQEMEAAVGMHKANLGQQGNETSGRAINARRAEGDTATFHFIDNLARSIEQLGRVVVDMIPRIYDTRRRSRILGVNGEQSFVEVDPKLPQPSRKEAGKVVAINPGVGAYDVRVKVGPSFSTQRQEAGQQLTEIISRSPQLMAVLGPMWARLQDFPEADKLAKVLLAMAPPQVQALEKGDAPLPPEVQAQIEQMKQVMQQMEQAMGQAAERIQQLQSGQAEKMRELDIKQYEAETKRLAAVQPVMTPEAIAPVVLQVLQGLLQQSPPPLPELVPPDLPAQSIPSEPPSGGFFMPEQGPDPAQAAAEEMPNA